MSISRILQLIEENQIVCVDFRVTGPLNRWLHISYAAEKVTEKSLKRGISFDGSSVPGFAPIENSDMLLVPDGESAFVDPFTDVPTLIVFCDVHAHTEGGPHAFGGDPRSTAKRAEAYLVKSGIAEKAFFGPELEFFAFDAVRYESTMFHSSFTIDADEMPTSMASTLPGGDHGYRVRPKEAYCVSQPVDRMQDMRTEIMAHLHAAGVVPSLHHHEVATNQCEVGFDFDTLVRTADNVQKYKYIVHNVAQRYGKTVTFMPKPLLGENGSGMHVHQSLWTKDKTQFAGDQYAGLSDEALYYIGGIIAHGKALAAFTNPTTNSYKRLVPGYEAPIYLSYSAHNRSAAVRIPYGCGPAEKRVETRFPDPASNPYLAFAALMMAGLDGIRKRIHPGDAIEKNLYRATPEELVGISQMPQNLTEALNALAEDHAFLTEGGVFTSSQIQDYIALKRKEVQTVEIAPNPVEFSLYYTI